MLNNAAKTPMTSMLAIAASLAFAAEAAAQVVPDVDTLTVTAQRRAQDPQDVSISLSVIDGASLAERGVETINNLENIVPGLEVENQFGSAQPSFAIRGVGFRDYATLNAPTVGVYVNDVPFPIPVMTQGVLFDIDRVEVLRGPQGTLYGRNTTGGAIKVIANKPTDDLSAGLMVEGGRFGRVEAEGFVSGAIADGVRARLSGVTSHGGDWQINRETGQTLGDEERYAMRGLIEADLSENVLATFDLHGFIDKSDGLGLQLFNDSVFGPLAHEGQRSTSFGSSPDFAALVGIETDTGPFRDNEGWGASATIEAGFSGFDLTYIGSFEKLDRKEFNDFDGQSGAVAGVFFDTGAEVISQELRLQGEISDRLKWLVGGFFSDENLDDVYQSDFIDSFGPGFAVTTLYTQEVRTYAGFFHGEFALNDRLSLIGGFRYEDETRELTGLGTFATGFGPFNFANGTVNGALENRELNSDNVSGKAGIDFHASDDLLVYAHYSRGVKSGGFTAYNTLNPQAIDPFRPEKLNAYEAGVKTSFADGAVIANAAAFYYDYTDQQVQSAIFDPGTGAIVGRIVNAPESEIFGFEADVTLRPAPWLEIVQGFAYKDGEFKEFTDLDTAATGASGTAVFVDREGQDLGLPNISYQGLVRTTTALTSGLNIDFTFDYAFRDVVAPPLLGPIYAVDDYWLANAQIALRPTEGAWSIAFWGRNIFNTDFDETRNFFAGPGGLGDVAAPGQPATYGARVTLAY